MKIRILGCGGSFGSPLAWGRNGNIDIDNVNNFRTRSSVLISDNQTTLLIDTSPDLRQQLYLAKCTNIDAVFMALHGNPTEDGLIQPYFDSLNISFTSCNAEISALTFNKYECNKKLKELGFSCANSFLHKKEDTIFEDEIIDLVKLPCFVKPNEAGSSFGISKVRKKKI